MKWQVIQTKGEYEPWWFFENWQETIEADYAFQMKEEAFQKYNELTNILIKTYPKHRLKKEVLFAAWNEEEVEYCESCDDDIQVFHGIILLCDGKVYQPEAQEKEQWFKNLAKYL
ncbi:DUF1033 family protein [Listeria sp. PSOL-1]|uniref:DUF1033 family protein n=1 Tax=Listeria sp. PSOL-1 TaxID=1844999 RepID=UPI0013D159C1|nr:DUF1033 family protein [Listeria sp. PSOL-1]